MTLEPIVPPITTSNVIVTTWKELVENCFPLVNEKHYKRLRWDTSDAFDLPIYLL